MITTKQKWTLGALVTLSAAIWLPQIVGSSGTEAQVGLDGPTEAEMLEMDAEYEAMLAADEGDAGGPAPERVVRRDPESVEGPDQIVGSILGALGTSDVFSRDARHRALEGLAADWARESGEAGATVRSPLTAFLEDNPLRGTMTSATSRTAMMGSYTLREGDRIPGTDARLVEIERNGVVVENDGARMDVALPPLRASERYARRRARRVAPMGGGDEEIMVTPEGGDQ